MSTLKWLLLAAAAIAAAFLGLKTHYQKKLERARERTLRAHREAIHRGDNEAASALAAALGRIELDLERERGRSTYEQVQRAWDYAKALRAGRDDARRP